MRSYQEDSTGLRIQLAKRSSTEDHQEINEWRASCQNSKQSLGVKTKNSSSTMRTIHAEELKRSVRSHPDPNGNCWTNSCTRVCKFDSGFLMMMIRSASKAIAILQSTESFLGRCQARVASPKC